MKNPDLTPCGAIPIGDHSVDFRVWAPRRRQVAVEILAGDRVTRRIELSRIESGYFVGNGNEVETGTAYRFLLDRELRRPDPVSRFQPLGVHGPSEIVPTHFPWTDQAWSGIARRDLVIYELHVGTWTSSGTFLAAIDRLDELRELGVTAIELLPVAQSPGRWNWGYDGVNLFAPRNTYGTPDQFKQLVNAAHDRGLAVILDVVYNHLGPEGNYLADFGPYFSRRHRTPWGEAFNFDGRHAEHVRAYILQNVIYWLDTFHLDGLRLDAVHFMYDESERHILTSIRDVVDLYARQTSRQLHLIAETNVFEPTLVIPNGENSPYEAIWSDCLMHSVYSLGVPHLNLTRRQYSGAKDVAEALEHGYLYSYLSPQGGPERMSTTRRQQIHGVEKLKDYLESMVVALQTHDSVGNHPQGSRLHQLTSLDFQKSVATLFLLYPSIPMIFMGEECASESPFPFFADFEDPRLRRDVDRGRVSEYPHHDWRNSLLPSDPAAFYRARYDESSSHAAEMRSWYRALLRLRAEGIRDQWLTGDRMAIAWEASTNLFTVTYRIDAGCQIDIYVVLAGPTSPIDSPATVHVDGEIYLASSNLLRTLPSVTLLPNQVLICGPIRSA